MSKKVPRELTRGKTSDRWIPLRLLILPAFDIVLNLHLLRIRWDRGIFCKTKSAPVAWGKPGLGFSRIAENSTDSQNNGDSMPMLAEQQQNRSSTRANGGKLKGATGF